MIHKDDTCENMRCNFSIYIVINHKTYILDDILSGNFLVQSASEFPELDFRRCLSSWTVSN